MHGVRSKVPGEIVILKIHKSVRDYIVAACDKELLGKTIIDKDKGLELKVSQFFYGGEKCTEKELVKQMRQATIINLIGEKTISTAIKYEFINKDSVIFIGKIPHAQIIRML